MSEQDLLIIEEIEDMMDTLLGEIEPQALFYYLFGRPAYVHFASEAGRLVHQQLVATFSLPVVLCNLYNSLPVILCIFLLTSRNKFAIMYT